MKPIWTKCTGGLLSAVVVLVTAASAWAEAVRVTGMVYRGEEVNESLTDLLLVELARQNRVEVLERRQLQIVLGELSLAALIDDAWRQTRLGRLLGVDAFVWIRLHDDRATLEVVEAATGRGMAARQEAIEHGETLRTLKSLGGFAVRAARQGPPAIRVDTPTLALAEPIVASADENAHDRTEAALLRLAEELQRLGATILHRRFLKDLVLERWMMDQSLTDAQRRELPMLGARYVLTVRVPEEGSSWDVWLLETRTGRRVGHRAWDAGRAQGATGRAEMARWILRRVEPHAPPPRRPGSKPVGDDLPLQPETLAPFYRGVLLHNQGMYLDAAEQFREAIRADRRFLQPYRWLQSCFVASGFDEISRAFGDYVDRAREDAWHGVSHPKALHADPGVALIGVTSEGGVESPLRIAAAMSLIDALHGASGAPVFVTDDMAQLRDEFDALVGLENVSGTTWQQAPPMLFVDTFTGHLEQASGGLRLRLCVTGRLDANHIAAASIDLADEPGRWREQMAAAGADLLRQAPARRQAWKRPPLRLNPDDIPAAELTAEHYTPLRYLKCVARDGQFVDNLRYPYNNDWFENVMMPGLHRWFLRTLPQQSKVRPGVEFAYASFYGSGADWARGMEELARKHRADPVGLVARLNALLYRLDDTNLRSSQAELEEILSELEGHVPGILSRSDLQRYHDTNRLLRRALGMSDEQGRLDPGGSAYAQLAYRSPIAIRAGGTFPARLDYPGRVDDPRAKAIVDLAVLRCACRREQDIPVAVVKQLFQRFADRPDVLAYFSVSYGNKVFSNRIRAPGDDELQGLAGLYPVYARAVVDLLRQDPLPFDRHEVELLVGVHPWLKELEAKDAGFRHARQQLKEAVLDAVVKRRFRRPTPMAVFALLVSISRQGDPQMLPYLKTLADQSLAADPLEDRYWRVYAQWGRHQTPGERMQRYLPFYERVRRLHPTMAFDEKTVWYYFDFGLVFFRGGRFDLADEVLSTIAAWEAPRARNLSTLRANTYYLLALIRQRQRNVPEALRLARRAVDEVDDRQIGLAVSIGISGSRGGRGSTSNLKSLANDLIARLRNDADAPFRYPFDNRWQ